MSGTTSTSQPSSATSSVPATSTPNGPSGIPVARIGIIVGCIVGGIILLLLIGLVMVFYFCSTGTRPGRARNIRDPQAPGWAKRIWNAEGTIGAKHEKVKGKRDVESAAGGSSVVQQQYEYQAQQQQQQYEYQMQPQQPQQQQAQQYYPPPNSTAHQQQQWYGGQTQAYFPPPQVPEVSPSPPAAYGTVYYAPPGEAAKQDAQISVAER